MDLLQPLGAALLMGLLGWAFLGAPILFLLSTLLVVAGPERRLPGLSDYRAFRILVEEDARPVVTALILAALAVPIVGASLTTYDLAPYYYHDTQLLLTDGRRYVVAAVACLVPGLVAGYIGGRAVRRWFLPGAAFTYFLAQALAIFATRLAVGIVQPPVGVGMFCLDSCSSIVAPGGPITDVLVALPASVLAVGLAPFIEPGPCAVLATGILIWSAVMRGDPRAERRDISIQRLPAP